MSDFQQNDLYRYLAWWYIQTYPSHAGPSVWAETEYNWHILFYLFISLQATDVSRRASRCSLHCSGEIVVNVQISDWKVCDEIKQFFSSHRRNTVPSTEIVIHVDTIFAEKLQRIWMVVFYWLRDVDHVQLALVIPVDTSSISSS